MKGSRCPFDCARFERERKSCIEGAHAIIRNDPHTRAEKNRHLRSLKKQAINVKSKLDDSAHDNRDSFIGWQRKRDEETLHKTTDQKHVRDFLGSQLYMAIGQRLITLAAGQKLLARFDSLHELTKDQLCLIMKLQAPSGSNVLSAMIEAVDRIETGKQDRARADYFWIEVRLAHEYLNAGGKITDYERGSFAKVLRQFRYDCGGPPVSLFHESVGRARIKHLLEHLPVVK